MQFSIVTDTIQTIISVGLYLTFYLPFLWERCGDILMWMGQDPTSEFQRGLVFLFIDSLKTRIIDLPFDLYYTFVLEEKHGYNKKTWQTFVKDEILEFLVMAVVLPPILYGFLYIIENGGPYFYIYVEFFVIIVIIVMMTLYPNVIAPLFNKFTELPESELRQKINSLAAANKFPLTRIYEMDGSKRSAHSNAYMYGFGSNKRIVLFDTLKQQMSNDEIVAVLAHELGHWKYNHTWKNLINTIIQTFFIFYIYGMFMNDKAIFASFGFANKSIFIGIMLFTTIYSPVLFVMKCVTLKLSRTFEFQADEFAVLQNYGTLLKSGLINLFKENKGTLIPDPLYAQFHYSHPGLLERVKHIDEFARVVEKNK
eukprot:TRINITY_DN5651_c0_g1_i6.p1 TRINITY_DN5651_c0_g1~~TRINITY_DN5651_c0_g1_i6.p1  ORF type:complete len:368 (+),score=75.57 TRINITY_DN5651_c0_g1_i6:410-1513(+)